MVLSPESKLPAGGTVGVLVLDPDVSFCACLTSRSSIWFLVLLLLKRI